VLCISFEISHHSIIFHKRPRPSLPRRVFNEVVYGSPATDDRLHYGQCHREIFEEDVLDIFSRAVGRKVILSVILCLDEKDISMLGSRYVCGQIQIKGGGWRKFISDP